MLKISTPQPFKKLLCFVRKALYAEKIFNISALNNQGTISLLKELSPLLKIEY
jgi:hypothetical protein